MFTPDRLKELGKQLVNEGNVLLEAPYFVENLEEALEEKVYINPETREPEVIIFTEDLEAPVYLTKKYQPQQYEDVLKPLMITPRVNETIISYNKLLDMVAHLYTTRGFNVIKERISIRLK